MVAKRVDAGAKNSKPRRPPATTPEAREMQLQAYAYDLVEQRLLDGTATAQETVYFLKSSSTREKLEQERLRKENLLAEARVDQIASSTQDSELYEEVLRAMKIYTGEESERYDEF